MLLYLKKVLIDFQKAFFLKIKIKNLNHLLGWSLTLQKSLSVNKSVAIIGASADPSRYSNQAFDLLLEFGHSVYLVNPNINEIQGHRVYPNLTQIKDSIDTVTMYVNATHSNELIDQIIGLGPKRVIFNPGSENPSIYKRLQESGIDFEEACTLVLLRTGQF